MKKVISALIILALLSVFSSCASVGEFGLIYSGDIELTDDCIVDASVFEKIKESSSVVSFIHKDDNGEGYRWTVYGDKIDEARTVDFSADITRDASGEIGLSFGSDSDIGFAPVFSIILRDLNKAGYEIISSSGESYGSVTPSKVSDSLQAISFTPESLTSTFRFKPVPENEYDIETEASTSEVTSAEEAESTKSSDTPETTELPEKEEPSAAAEENKTAAEPSSAPETTVPVIPTESAPPDEPATAPEEPDNSALTCTVSIECASVFNHLDDLDPAKLSVLPSGGIILSARSVEFTEGETVFDVLLRVCRDNGIHFEYAGSASAGSIYIEGINNLYEFDCGPLSGWMYRVNGWYPNYGCSNYTLSSGDVVEFRYSCDLGHDIGDNWLG